MIKSKLINNMAHQLPQIQEKDVAAGINLILDMMSDTLTQGERIEIRGFGSFTLHYRAPRQAHNPKTGERVMTKAKYSPHFKPGKELRERVNESRDKPIRAAADDSDESDDEASTDSNEDFWNL